MSNKNVHLDEYYRSFAKGQYSEFRAEQASLESESTWLDGVTTKTLSLSPLDSPIEALSIANTPGNTIPHEILDDTSRNAGLILNDPFGKQYCLRDCSIPSLQNTLRLRGEVLAEMEKFDLADEFNRAFKYARNASRILIRGGKASAFLSMQYEYMPGSELLDICDGLQKQFGPANFVGGAICHSMTVAEWEYPASAAKITQAYNNALISAHKSPATTALIPVIQYRASDTSNASAMLLTYLKLGPGQYLPLGGVEVPHVPPRAFHSNGTRYTCMEKFKEEAETLFSKLEYDIADLVPKMLATQINYPGNCFLGVAKYAGIPQKWGGRIEQDLRQDFPDGSDCSFLDIYEALTNATALAIQDGFDPQSTRVLDLEEGISKVAKNKASWKRFDLPGTVAWSTPTVRNYSSNLQQSA